MSAAEIALFAIAFLAFAASPGPDNVAIIARSAARGPLAGVSYGVGVVVGILVGLAAASLGLAFVLSKFGWLGLALRYVGAAYLIWSGVKLWRNADHLISSMDEPKGSQDRSGREMSGLAVGFAMNLTNPKMPIFYLAVLPQSFLGQPSFAAAVTIAMVIVFIEVLVIGAAIALGSLARSTDHVRSGRIARASGAMLVVAGVAIIARR
ncbi:MAG: LysE family translocator [Sphingomonas sp.]|uniref:LysE family translocator n=1 Tax=Sphingomonas sp. TaxID=28214 RepID=UPI003569D120